MRKALVIGAQTGDLTGVHGDVTTMTTLLTQRGFAVEPATGGQATRDGILIAYQNLIAATNDGDAVVVYFSGHGGLAKVFAEDGNPLPTVQFIVPTDYDDSRPGDFRGVTAIELSVLLSQLTDRTHNVAVLLDCCHAAHVSKNRRLRVRALAHPSYLDVGVHLGMLQARGLPVDRPDAIGNPYAVRLVACAPWESAYEYAKPGGQYAGVVTDSFRVALQEVGDAPVTWSQLTQRIRDRTTELVVTGQRPEVEGPSRRVLFELDEARTGTAFTVVQKSPDRVTLPGAALLGVAVGDRFVITAAGVAEVTDATTVARATVTATSGALVEASVELCAGRTALPAVAEAHPREISIARRAVSIGGDGPLLDPLKAAVAAEPTLRVVTPEDQKDDDVVLAEVEVGAALALRDFGTVPLVSVPAEPAGIGRIVADLVRLARTDVLRQLAPRAGAALTDPFTVEWGLVVNGVPRPLERSGVLLHAGDRLYLKLRNDSDRELYFFAFDLGVSGAVQLITTSDPSGLRLDPMQEYVVGEHELSGHLQGAALYWPEGVPEGDPRPETILVVVTSSRQDLSVLAHEGVRVKDLSTSDGLRFTVVRLDAQMSAVPVSATKAEPGFLVDERPHPSLRLLAPRTRGAAAPPTLAVRLNELIVHRNRALLGTDIRVDALVVTGGENDRPVYKARTVRFSNVRDGDRLPLDNLLVYHGPVVDYLDLAWWVTRDRRNSLALNDLLRERLTDDDLGQAIESVAALAAAAPQAAAAAAAVGAVGLLVTTAYELLARGVGNSIGLYRTTLLAGEGFGVGRHPISGTRPAQDFSFAYEIVEAGRVS